MYTGEALRQARLLNKYLRDNNIDIVQTYGTISDLWGTVVAHNAGVRCIISSRRDLGAYRDKHHLLFSKLTNRHVSHFLAPCNAVAKSLIDRESLHSSRVTTVYNGFDPQTVAAVDPTSIADLWQKFGLDFTHFVVGNVSHLRPEKGHEVFLQALNLVKKRTPHLRAILVGGGPELERIRALAKELDLTDVVHFTGFVDQVMEHIALMDVCCLTPTANEGFSNALLEQMAMQKPVVASRIGGNVEAIIDGESGVLVAPAHVEALAEALCRLHDDSSLRNKLAVNARRRVFEHFTVDSMVDAHLALYRNLLESGAANSSKSHYVIHSGIAESPTNYT